ncbi:uncharacterized protein LOC125947207 [Dermacentor silvarum]|uniref:uncharacterized protein LOC125947207 n=1 Tax=Dermacentor silvarum TaxID=543639 RepID=UPI00210101FF|nr:uncharacterized protein LOC125947207 [Dermacentor silvarum]
MLVVVFRCRHRVWFSTPTPVRVTSAAPRKSPKMSYCNSCRARLPEAKDLEIQHAFSIETFLDSGEFTDFEFRVKMEDHPDIPERRVRVHKLFLAMRNEVFRAMLFCGDLAETCGGVIITDVHPDGFDLLLR